MTGFPSTHVLALFARPSEEEYEIICRYVPAKFSHFSAADRARIVSAVRHYRYNDTEFSVFHERSYADGGLFEYDDFLALKIALHEKLVLAYILDDPTGRCADFVEEIGNLLQALHWLTKDMYRAGVIKGLFGKMETTRSRINQHIREYAA